MQGRPENESGWWIKVQRASSVRPDPVDAPDRRNEQMIKRTLTFEPAIEQRKRKSLDEMKVKVRSLGWLRTDKKKGESPTCRKIESGQTNKHQVGWWSVTRAQTGHLVIVAVFSSAGRLSCKSKSWKQSGGIFEGQSVILGRNFFFLLIRLTFEYFFYLKFQWITINLIWRSQTIFSSPFLN